MKFTVSLVVFDKHYNRIKLIAKENDNFYKYYTSYEVFVLFFTQETIKFWVLIFLIYLYTLLICLFNNLFRTKTCFLQSKPKKITKCTVVRFVHYISKYVLKRREIKIKLRIEKNSNKVCYLKFNLKSNCSLRTKRLFI